MDINIVHDTLSMHLYLSDYVKHPVNAPLEAKPTKHSQTVSGLKDRKCFDLDYREDSKNLIQTNLRMNSLNYVIYFNEFILKMMEKK